MPRRSVALLSYIAIVILAAFATEYILSQLGSSKWRTENAVILKLLDEKWRSQETPLMLRQGETLEPKSAGKKRILVVGDSFVYGDGYTNSNQIWWGALQQELIMSGYQDVEIIAAGHNGLSAFEEYKLLEQTSLIADVDPDLILMTWVPNDLESKAPGQKRDGDIPAYVTRSEKNSLAYKTIRQTYADTPLGYLGSIFPNIAYSAEAAIINKYADNADFNKTVGYGESSFYDSIFSDTSFAWNEQNFFQPFSEFVRGLDIPTAYIIMPSTAADPAITDSLTRVMQLFDHYKINYYQYLDDFSKLDLSDGTAAQYINPVNSHPSHNITSFYAKSVLSSLKTDHSPILGEQVPYQSQININDATPWGINLTKISDNEYRLSYPPAETPDNALTMPIGKKFIKLNFQTPVSLSHISIQSDHVKQAEIWYNRIGDKGYDDQNYLSLDSKTGGNPSWDFSAQLVTSINLHIDFTNQPDRTITVRLTP